MPANGSLKTQVEALSEEECRELLGHATVGRVGFVVDGRPIVLPVNYTLLTGESGLWVLLRTRPGNMIDGAPQHVAFEIDGFEADQRRGWSVLVRGLLRRLDHNEIELFAHRFDPRPLAQQERTCWLAIKPEIVTGRRLHAGEREWTLPSDAYI